MKKNRLMIVIVVLVLVIAGSYFLNKNEKTSGGVIKIDKKTDIPTVGVLQFVSHPALDTIYEGIKDGLKQGGYDPDKNTVKIEFQNGQGDHSKLGLMSQQLIEKKSDILIGIATPAAQALANETKDIPIVLGSVSDPVGSGLIKDNEKPGGNITGVSDKTPVDAQVDLIKKVLPDAKKIGVLYSSGESNSAYQVEEFRKEAEKNGYTVKLYAAPSTNEILQIVQVMSNEVDFIFLPKDNTMANAMPAIVDAANKQNTPIIASVDTMVEQGGVAAISTNQYEAGVQTGKMAALILSGKADPATTPIHIFTKGDIIINAKQAEKLGIKIPEDVLEKAIIVGDK